MNRKEFDDLTGVTKIREQGNGSYAFDRYEARYKGELPWPNMNEV